MGVITKPLIDHCLSYIILPNRLLFGLLITLRVHSYRMNTVNILVAM